MKRLIAKAQGFLYQRFGSTATVRAIYKNSFFRSLIHFIFRDLISGIYQIEITSICNAKCIFCSYPKIAEDKASLVTISPETFQYFLDFARKTKKRKIHMGPLVGENFVNKEWSKYLQIILNEEYVDNVKFITNGILMGKEQVESFVSMSHTDKLSIDISIGGSDAETYKFMYGVDRYKNVHNNVRHLLQRCQEARKKIAVNLEFRVPNAAQFDLDQAIREFNPSGYKNFAANTLDSYDDLNGLSEARENQLRINSFDPEKRKPCKLLSNILFRSGGDITLCGCVTSSGEHSEGLIVGQARRDGHDEVIRRQKEIIEKWRRNREIPKACRKCSLYLPA